MAKGRGRRSRFEIAFEAAILNLVVIKELDAKIQELQNERNKIFEEKKDELREIFKMGYDACAEQMKGKIEPDYTLEEIEEPVVVESNTEEPVIIESKTEEPAEIDIEVSDEPVIQEEEPVVETKPKEIEDYSTQERDVVDSVACCRVCKKRCIPYDNTTAMTLLHHTLELPTSTVPEIKGEVEKTIEFLGQKQANVEINKTGRELLEYMMSLTNDVNPEQYIMEHDISNDQFIASVDKTANAVKMSTRGAVELQWYSTDSDGSDYSQFESLRLRLVFVKRIYTVFDRNLIDKRYRKMIDKVDHYKEN